MPLNNFGIVVPGLLYRSAQLDSRAARDVILLGIDTVIKLSTPEEFPIEVEAQIFSRFTELPSSAKINLQQRNISWFHPDIESVRNVSNEINARLNWGEKVLVHCTHGRDRTGLIIGAWQLMHGEWSLAEVFEELMVFGVKGIIEIADHEIRECLTKIAADPK